MARYFSPPLHEDCDPYEGCREINECEWVAPIGWYEENEAWDERPIICTDEVPTHWMPLPEPPKETL